MIEGLYGISGSTEYYPELLASEVVLTSNDDGTVTGAYTLRDGLVWSDGDDLTADDVKWTFDVILAADGEDEDGNPNYIYLLGDRTGSTRSPTSPSAARPSSRSPGRLLRRLQGCPERGLPDAPVQR